MEKKSLREKHHKVDFCVVGGGMAGLAAAISAARGGAKVLLIQDRPVLGGNASSEIRMWVCGCHGENNRETGIMEEISIENMYRNPTKNFSIWDSILYEKVKQEENITLLLNCSCNEVEMDGDRIKRIKGWQLTTYTWHTVEAKLFADCSGDSILAPLCGAQYRVGRESSDEFGEDIAPKVSDKKTMGMSCLIQAREVGKPVKYIPPSWAYKYESEEQLPYRDHDLKAWHTNFWWLELGGVQDSIHDTEEIRDELLKVAFGVWDHIKNIGDHNAENWELDWIGFLPGKRESRRYVGDYIMTQNDVRNEGRFDDIVAYGGWSMDDHHPEGLNYPGKPTIFHPAPAPYGIPYRSLYSKNISNLFFAGRNISVTHTAMSSTRVMRTCAILGQAVGTAAAMAVEYNLSPRGIYKDRIAQLKQKLMDDDCYLPWNKRQVSELSKNARLSATTGDADVLRNGIERPIGEDFNGWIGNKGDIVEYSFDNTEEIKEVRLVFDSDLNRQTLDGHETLRRYDTLANRFYEMEPFGFPKTMVKAFKIEYLDADGEWSLLMSTNENRQRLIKLSTDIKTKAIRFMPIETWGLKEVHLFSFEVR